jgi:hypothetical protein
MQPAGTTSGLTEFDFGYYGWRVVLAACLGVMAGFGATPHFHNGVPWGMRGGYSAVRNLPARSDNNLWICRAAI